MKTFAPAALVVVLLVGHVLSLPPGGTVVEEPEFDVTESLVPEEISKKDKDEPKFEILDDGTRLKIVPVERIAEDLPLLKVSYEGSQLWRVVAETKEKKRVIGKLRDNRDISMWGGNVSAYDILVREKSKDVVKTQLQRNLIPFEVVIDDVQKAIDDENPPVLEDDEELVIRQGHRMSWTSYHRLNDIHGYLDYLAQTYPQICSVQTIGSSVHGRSLKVLRISNGKQGNKAIWVDGGMHAREWISPATVTYIINHFVLNMESESEEIANMDWYFLPVANPDGYEYSHTNDRLWRKNRAGSGQCAGVDLNRNFGYKWGGKGSGRNPCQETYGGKAPFSEPETSAIRNFFSANSANWKGYISFHSYGQYILFPWGYDRVITTDYKDLMKVAQKAASVISAKGGPGYTVGPAGSTLYPASGGSDDWAKGSIGIKYAYTIELRDSGRYGFVLPANYIQPTAVEALAALRVIAQASYTA